MEYEPHDRKPARPEIDTNGMDPRPDLVPPEIEVALSRVLAYGAHKFGDRKWEKGLSWSRVFGSTLKHLFNFWRGRATHPGSKLPVLWHALTNLAFLIVFEMRKQQGDDRPK